MVVGIGSDELCVMAYLTLAAIGELMGGLGVSGLQRSMFFVEVLQCCSLGQRFGALVTLVGKKGRSGGDLQSGLNCRGNWRTTQLKVCRDLTQIGHSADPIVHRHRGRRS